MANGGAWRSDVFDNGRDFHHGDKQTSPVPGVPAAMYNPAPSMGGGQDAAYMPIVSMALRGGATIFSAVAFLIIASNSGTYEGYSFKYWRALNSPSAKYLLAIDIIVCVYSIAQLVLSIVSACSGSPVLKAPKSPGATITFVLDQGLTYMLMGGCGALASRSSHACEGLSGVMCDKTHASVAMSFIAFAAIALSSAIAYFRLYRMA